MRKYLIGLSLLVATIISAQKTSAKVVVNSRGELIGPYVKENATKYQYFGNDYGWVPKKGHKVVIYSASKGQGSISPKNIGTVNVRKSPNTNSPIVSQLTHSEGLYPDEAQCLGYSNGWFKILLDGAVGYVKADVVEWNVWNQ